MHLTYFCRLGYLCAKNYQIWWKFDEVLTKTSWVFLGTPCTYRVGQKTGTMFLYANNFFKY